MRLLHLGNVVVDLVLTVGELPVRGGDVIASGTAYEVGGGFNVLAAASRLGVRCVYCGAHGSGPFGDRARAALVAEGVEWLRPAKVGVDTGFVVALVDAEGERTFVTSRGAEATLTIGDLPASAADDLVYVTGYSLLHPSNRDALLAWLPQAAGIVFFDPGPLAAEIPAEALKTLRERADWWSCNAREAQALTGHADPVAAGVELAGSARSGALVRIGSRGCVLVVRRGEPVVIDGFGVTAVDLNGAGDAHAGAFLAGLAEGKDPAAAARWANAAAALAVTRRGPATGPTREALETFLAGPDMA
jgi:sugar/nucleoside kinase (ribokinase family)